VVVVFNKMQGNASGGPPFHLVNSNHSGAIHNEVWWKRMNRFAWGYLFALPLQGGWQK
jgi:hypothetical protein